MAYNPQGPQPQPELQQSLQHDVEQQLVVQQLVVQQEVVQQLLLQQSLQQSWQNLSPDLAHKL